MGIIAWIVLGLIAGWLASIVMKTNSGAVGDIILGIIGAILGGFLMNLVGSYGITGFNLYSIIVATIGAVVFIWVGRLLRFSA
ncbi:GlsB/YeaQ/YmgE family stress response membrane protein [Candidatus Cerribacteria bacterium 'Amazon FNV 2010 28 9']|uniref:GlsB/YeaQ/YmgE family stress response membrane protein n=1 Tax=Candidatus Cerribacteria bacterium 'Amazon FNV 2010 28 9' TaxID=2081795 RepID=A0A317JNZ5_9BACT|nr:MAG: GlsB/YeaQ/YmgE family stress response membrane protein [Candidatus Cerribacteria bacterium 'Amazon FNV 2010 28 9']